MINELKYEFVSINFYQIICQSFKKNLFFPFECVQFVTKVLYMYTEGLQILGFVWTKLCNTSYTHVHVFHQFIKQLFSIPTVFKGKKIKSLNLYLYTISFVEFSSNAQSNRKVWFSKYLVKSTLSLGSCTMVHSLFGMVKTSTSFFVTSEK